MTQASDIAAETGGKFGIISPAAAGSLGDQAMVDASAGYVTSVLGRRAVVGPKPTHIRSKVRAAKGTGPVETVRLMSNMLLTCKSIGCIGADIIDGVYGAPQAMKRIRMLRTAHLLGRKTRIWGASWSETPSDIVAEAIRKADWLEICARDPISQGRMERTFGRPVRLTADLAFLLQPEIRSAPARQASDWIKAQKQAGQTIMGVNLSGHTVRTLPEDGVRDIAAPIIRWLQLDPQRSLLLMPHDRRGGMVGDAVALARLQEILPPDFSDRMHVLPTTLDTWELKALAGMIDLVLTGRMHLAIAAMGMGTPALCTVYQGKFEGLMQMFALDGMTVAPRAMNSAECDAQLARITEQRNALHQKILTALPRIQALSRSNFDEM